MKFTSLALLALVGGVSAGKPQISVRFSINNTDIILYLTTLVLIDVVSILYF